LICYFDISAKSIILRKKMPILSKTKGKRMNMKGYLCAAAVLLFAAGTVSCSRIDSKLDADSDKDLVQQIKGTYSGSVEVSRHNGENIVTLPEVTAVSSDSLAFMMSLQPIADIVKDAAVLQRLKEIGSVEVKAGYGVKSNDDRGLFFNLNPKRVVIAGGSWNIPSIRIEFSQTFGGEALIVNKYLMFEVSPTELWVDGRKSTEYSQLVYHFAGISKL
jgi:hypothetical protein